MADDVEVRGLDNLAHLSRALREAGDGGKGLRRELYAGLNRATKPVRDDLKAAIEPSLPRAGGLAARVAKSARFATSTRTAQRTTAVRIVARGKGRRTLAEATQEGSFRHPVFAKADKPRKDWTWVTQTAGVRRGLLDEAFERRKPRIKQEVLRAIEDTRAQLYRRA